MNMSNITCKATRLSTFVFKKSSEKIYSRLYSWLKRVLLRVMLAQIRRRWPNVISQLGQCIVLSGYCYLGSGSYRGNKASPPWQVEQTRKNHPILFQCWANVENCGSILKKYWVNAMCLLIWHLQSIQKSHSWISVGPAS